VSENGSCEECGKVVEHLASGRCGRCGWEATRSEARARAPRQLPAPRHVCESCGLVVRRLTRGGLCGSCSYAAAGKTARSEAILDRYLEPARFFVERER
jgi:hypothetical protein